VSIAAAAAVLDVIQDEDLISRARVVGLKLRARIEAAVEGRIEFGELRGAGLYLGLDMRGDSTRDATQLTAEFVNSMRNHGVLISATGVHSETLKIRPPLVFRDEHVDTFMAAFSSAMNDIAQ
jgi:4-aminobutyrate aminotransferase-like enzyme